MPDIHYFVVGGVLEDDGEVRFFVDDPVCNAMFTDGTIWDTKSRTWRIIDNDFDVTESNLDWDLSCILADTLTMSDTYAKMYLPVGKDN